MSQLNSKQNILDFSFSKKFGARQQSLEGDWGIGGVCRVGEEWVCERFRALEIVWLWQLNEGREQKICYVSRKNIGYGLNPTKVHNLFSSPFIYLAQKLISHLTTNFLSPSFTQSKRHQAPQKNLKYCSILCQHILDLLKIRFPFIKNSMPLFMLCGMHN